MVGLDGSDTGGGASFAFALNRGIVCSMLASEGRLSRLTESEVDEFTRQYMWTMSHLLAPMDFDNDCSDLEME